MSTRGWLLSGAVVALLLIVLPLGLTSYQIGLATKMLILALLAMSLDLLLGYTALPSLGHAAFFGVGAYLAALLTLKAGLNPWLAFPIGLVAAALTGALYGLLAL